MHGRFTLTKVMQESTEIFNQCLCVEEFITSVLVQGHCQKGDSHYCTLTETGGHCQERVSLRLGQEVHLVQLS